MSGSPADAGFPATTLTNQCEIDVDFGAIEIGEGSSTSIEIVNLGGGALDLSQPTGGSDSAFLLAFGTPRPLQPGSFYEFTALFQPAQAGTVSSVFLIETDGLNAACPAPPAPYDTTVITVILTGTGS